MLVLNSNVLLYSSKILEYLLYLNQYLGKWNLTSIVQIVQCTKLTIELFAIQLLETFHKFSTLLLNFDSIAQFFFKQWVI